MTVPGDTLLPVVAAAEEPADGEPLVGLRIGGL